METYYDGQNRTEPVYLNLFRSLLLGVREKGNIRVFFIDYLPSKEQLQKNLGGSPINETYNAKLRIKTLSQVFSHGNLQEIAASSAVISQLLGQTVYCIQQVLTACETIRAAPKMIKDTKAHLDNLLRTVVEVEGEPGLHTLAIYDQLQLVNEVTTELKAILDGMEMQQQKTKIHQGVSALFKPKRAEMKLNSVLDRLLQRRSTSWQFEYISFIPE
ncbi:hypothetical protein B0H63DRAFT_444568 [Podospora didyma]|uniref:Uncharacterized protein n=1 Tax=Podospora didyma TaxID=330526 RepID=A0AAE0U8F5_9PEZI|nr:hypothetical protein B0H63DRAFT_444568 [Podospora didyma]